MLTHLRDLAAHAAWADAMFFGAWGSSGAVDSEDLRRRAGHIFGVQQGFLSILRTEPFGMPPSGPPPTFEELKARGESAHAALRDYVAALDPADLSRSVQVPWFPDPPCIVTVAEALVQVAMHSQHHRGQCMTRLKDVGGEPRNVDWIIWLWKGKPPADWA
jgi:uncharacterized damage-inducible protein DinB